MANAVYHANGALRRMGRTPTSTSARGPQAYAKLALSKTWKTMDKITGRAAKPLPKSESTFEIDLASDTGYRDRAAV
jgi:hypothetical protein